MIIRIDYFVLQTLESTVNPVLNKPKPQPPPPAAADSAKPEENANAGNAPAADAKMETE